jgi:hypothetical protein
MTAKLLMRRKRMRKDVEKTQRRVRGVESNDAPLSRWKATLFRGNGQNYQSQARLVDHLMTDNINAARTFMGTFRYIDDILSADNPSFERYVKLVGNNEACVRQMYPDYLSLPE